MKRNLHRARFILHFVPGNRCFRSNIQSPQDCSKWPVRWRRFVFVMVLGIILGVGIPEAGMSLQPERSLRAAIPMVNVTGGLVGVIDNLDEPFILDAGYRFAAMGPWSVSPALGLAVAQNGAYYMYADVRRDFWLTDHWLLIPSFGVGAFSESEQLQLGHREQFRSGLEIAYQTHDRHRIGVAFFHISNGGITDYNPGTEILVLSFGIPLTPHSEESIE